jgi:heme O synthase-like polyprenyltransferase
MIQDREVIGRINRLGWIAAALIFSISLIFRSFNVSVAVLVGAILGNMNFYLLQISVARLFSKKGSKRKVFFSSILAVKTLVVMTVLYFFIVHLKLSVIGLLAGLSSLFIALVYGGLTADLEEKKLRADR